MLQRLPASNIPGSFPRELLFASEKVIFETRPLISGFLAVPLIVSILWDLLWVGTTFATPSLVYNPALYFFVLLPWIWVLVRWRNWRGTTYALTDRRVVRRSGKEGTKLQDAPTEFIGKVDLDGNTVRFRFGTPAGQGALAHGGGILGNQVIWNDLKGAAQVQVFASEWISLYALKLQRERVRQQLLARVLADKVSCSYCGTLLPLGSISYDRPQCPSCGAPLVEIRPVAMTP